MDNSLKHIPFLDGVRGLAVILVVLYHSAPLGLNKTLFDFGWSGVDLFFVLSGFLISRILLNTKQDNYYLRNFFARRFLRLFPLYYFVLFSVIFLVPLFGLQIPDLKNLKGIQVYFWTYTQNIYIALKGVPSFTGFNHFWSLGVEEQFYLVWPFVIKKLTQQKLIIVISLGVVVSVIIRNVNPFTPFAYMFTLCRTEGLLLGGLAALVAANKIQLPNFLSKVGLILTAACLIFVKASSGSLEFGTPFMIKFGYTVIDFFYFFLLITMFQRSSFSKSLKRIFSFHVLRLAGKYSYGIYVYHAILKYSLFNDSTFALQDFVYFTVLTVFVSVGSYHVLEMPFLNLKDKFASK